MASVLAVLDLVALEPSAPAQVTLGRMCHMYVTVRLVIGVGVITRLSVALAPCSRLRSWAKPVSPPQSQGIAGTVVLVRQCHPTVFDRPFIIIFEN
eukprot:2231157-Amphidinium_carterae.1